jgi:hypothetical protein
MSEDDKELLNRIKKIEKKLAKMDRESKIGLEDQLFFGVVVSLALFFIALPFTELTSLFQNVFLFDSTTALNVATGFRNVFVLFLLSSIALRYYGAIKPHKGARLWSILCLLFAFDLFLLSVIPAFGFSVSTEMKPIVIPLSYVVLAIIYGVMGKFVEPSIISFYAKRRFVLKRYSKPIVSILFIDLTACIYFVLASQIISFLVFKYAPTQFETSVLFLLFYFLLVGLVYSLYLRRQKIVEIKNPFRKATKNKKTPSPFQIFYSP